MRETSPLLRALIRAHAPLVLGLVAACTASNPTPDPGPGTGGSGGTGGANAGSGGTSGVGTGGVGGGSGGVGGAGGASGGTAGSAAGTLGKAGSSGSASGGGGSGGAAGALSSGGAGVGGDSGGMPAGGSAGDATGGVAGTTAGSGGDAGSGAGTGGSAGAAGIWKCPAGVTGTPTLGAATRVAGVPPPDSFNQNNGNFGNIEGPVWVDDALYVSEMSYMSYDQQNGNVKMARILKVTPAGQVSIEVADSGSNGLAVDAPGSVLAAVHKDGSIKRLALPGGAATTIVGTFMNARFDSPNDLAVHSATGTIYFSDPNFQAPNTLPQAQTRVYRVPSGGMAEPIPSAASPDQFGNPNGVTLSLAEDFLYVAASTGRRYPVMGDGTLGAGQDYAAASGGDGMTVDCAGNLYVAKANSGNVTVYTPTGTMIGNITVADVQAVTNVAFGGADHKTLYVTGLGNNKGLFQITMNLAGRQY